MVLSGLDILTYFIFTTALEVVTSITLILYIWKLRQREV